MNERPRNGSPLDEPADPELARLYHECSREEPPAHLDAVIRAGARRESDATARGPASERGRTVLSQAATCAAGLEQTPRPRAWRLPVSLAAVLVLSASVVVLMRGRDGERTGEFLPSAPQAMGDRSGTPEVRSRRMAPAPGRSDSEGALRDRRELTEPDTASRENARERADVAPQSAPAPDPSARAPAQASRDFSGLPVPRSAAPIAKELSAAAPSPLAAQYAHEPPEKWGEKIVELRRQGRSAEADDLLAEFRRRFPGHAVSEEWLP